VLCSADVVDIVSANMVSINVGTLIVHIYNIVVYPLGQKSGKETTGIIPDTWILDEHQKQKQTDEAVVCRAQPRNNWTV